jgi:hypothetical protein
MLAHHPVEGSESRAWICPDLGGQQWCGALDPSHMGIAFGTGAGEYRAGGRDGFNQLTLFVFERQLGTLHLDDLTAGST